MLTRGVDLTDVLEAAVACYACRNLHAIALLDPPRELELPDKTAPWCDDGEGKE